MSPRLERRRVKFGWLVVAAMAVSAVGVVFAPLAFAKIAMNTIDTTATLSPNGRHIHLTGPISCDQTQPVFMRVTVTQRLTGAVAEGYAYFTGTVVPQQWHVNAHAIGGTEFTPGAATAVGLGRSTTSPGLGGPDDAHQWLVNVTLVAE